MLSLLSRSIRCFIQPKLAISRFSVAPPPHLPSFFLDWPEPRVPLTLFTIPRFDAMDRNAIVWVDLEMTGLDVEKDVIMEMACLVTDQNLKVVAEAETLVLKVEDSILDGMDKWCRKQHRRTGLTASCRESEVTLEAAEAKMVEFLEKHVPKQSCPLAGNSIHQDRKFLEKYMPRFVDHLHYRIIDVSTVKELARRWYTADYREAPLKNGSHRALEDIKGSIEELDYYRRALFK